MEKYEYLYKPLYNVSIVTSLIFVFYMSFNWIMQKGIKYNFNDFILNVDKKDLNLSEVVIKENKDSSGKSKKYFEYVNKK